MDAKKTESMTVRLSGDSMHFDVWREAFAVELERAADVGGKRVAEYSMEACA